MRSCILLISILIVFVSSSLAQIGQIPTSTPASSQPNSGGQNQPSTVRQANSQIDARFDNLRSLELAQNPQFTKADILRQVVDPLYRKPGKKELKRLIPSQATLTEFKAFLDQPDTGIFKLSADTNCESNLKVVAAAEGCELSNIPGAGTAYSFRVKSHRMLHLSDLVLDKNVIQTGSLLQHGIMVNLGNIEPDKISETSAGLKYLIDFKPTTNPDELQSIEEQLRKGIKSDGFLYGIGLYVADKTTYALRSIAYRGKMMRSVSGVEYNEMDFDKRSDILVVFRVVEKAENGDLTIIWKEIARKDSPVIKAGGKEK